MKPKERREVTTPTPHGYYVGELVVIGNGRRLWRVEEKTWNWFRARRVGLLERAWIMTWSIVAEFGECIVVTAQAIERWPRWS